MSDWWACADKFSDGTCSVKNVAEMVKAQNDALMVCDDVVTNDDDLICELESGFLTLGELQRSAKRTLELALKSHAFKKLQGARK